MRSKRIVSTLVVFALLLVLVGTVLFLLISRNRNAQHDLSDFAFVEIGMGYAAIVDELGEPDREYGFGVPNAEYDLANGCTVSMSFSGEMRLIGAWVTVPNGGWVDFFDYRNQWIQQ